MGTIEKHFCSNSHAKFKGKLGKWFWLQAARLFCSSQRKEHNKISVPPAVGGTFALIHMPTSKKTAGGLLLCSTQRKEHNKIRVPPAVANTFALNHTCQLQGQKLRKVVLAPGGALILQLEAPARDRTGGHNTHLPTLWLQLEMCEDV